jgi:hypothetical protein
VRERKRESERKKEIKKEKERGGRMRLLVKEDVVAKN